jgi:hypothetical protein
MIAGLVPEFLPLSGVYIHPATSWRYPALAGDLCDIVGPTEWTYHRTTVRELRDPVDHIVETVVMIARAHRHNG